MIFPKGKLQVLTPFWDSRTKEDGGQKWQHLYPDEFIASQNQLNIYSDRGEFVKAQGILNTLIKVYPINKQYQEIKRSDLE